MPAEEPTLVATSGGWRQGQRGWLDVAPLVQHAVELSGAAGRPRLCYVGTAAGDQRWFAAEVVDAGRRAGLDVSVLNLFPMPSVPDVAEHLLAQDAVWVGGGSVVNLLAVWRAHGVDAAMRRAWQAGVVLGGVSAGSICWFAGGTTDSWGPDLRPVTDALGFLPYGNGVHHDSEPGRRPLARSLVAAGVLPETHCTDDGVGLVYRGTALVEAVAEVRGAGAWLLRRTGTGVAEERLAPRLLPGAR
ncbi:peptidase E [Kineococcus glutinatus]|uniref:Peptidase E n=1 Tax=Kineococcus glutinatus TaxID=1070872 RepID=A0ABP8VKJ1_9ACTN